MNFTAYSDYFENLATKLRDVAHTPEAPRFCHFNIEEVLAALAHRIDPDAGPCLFLESIEGRLSDSGDNVLDNNDGAFHILRAVLDPEDFAGQKAAVDEAMQIGLQIIARMRKDARTREGLMRYFEVNSVGYERVGYAFGNCFGYRFTFSFYNPISLVVDAAQWLP